MISRIFNKSYTSASRFISLKPQGVFKFSEKQWRERDEAAEKVYITQTQKLAMKKLLQKMNEQGTDNTAKQQLFESKLDQILTRHKVSNQAFKVQVLHLHKQL